MLTELEKKTSNPQRDKNPQITVFDRLTGNRDVHDWPLARTSKGNYYEGTPAMW